MNHLLGYRATFVERRRFYTVIEIKRFAPVGDVFRF